MSDVPQIDEASPAPPARTPRKGPSPLLFVLLLLLVGAIGAKLFDMRARQNAQAAFDEVSGQLDRINAGEFDLQVGSADIQKLVGRAPDGEMYEIGPHMVEEYGWQGALRRHIVYVLYHPGDPPLLHDASLNERPR